MSSAASLAQWSNATDPQNVAHQRAVEAYENQQYALALHNFESLMAAATSESSDAYVEANHYAAMSSLALYHRDAVYRVESFVGKFPESPLALEARWELANYHYKRKNYSTAAEEFNKIRVRELVT